MAGQRFADREPQGGPTRTDGDASRDDGGKGGGGDGRGARHRRCDREAHGEGRRQGRGERHRRVARRRGRRRGAGARGRRRDQGGRRGGDRQFRQRRRVRLGGKDHPVRRGHLRAHRLRGQQRRHPARCDLSQDERGRLGLGGERHAERRVQHLPSRRRSLPQAGIRQLRADDLDRGADRRHGPGQLRRGQARPGRVVEEHFDRHAALQRAFQLHCAGGVDAHDRLHPAERPGGGQAHRAAQAGHARAQRAARSVPRQRCGQGRDRPGVLRCARTRSFS